jgi:SAM-dependent methyltransferase
MRTSLQERAEAVPPGRFLGGPRKDFDRVGRQIFVLLLKHGLLPQHNVLDIGCGALRAGYWLIHFLDDERYCGIEPNVSVLKTGRRFILEPGLEEAKRPNYSNNHTFDFSVFDRRFDYAIARSIWTHAPKADIERMLNGFKETANPGAIFLASFVPARPIGVAQGGLGKKALWIRDYTGSEWLGKSHERKASGLVAHRWTWIKGACSSRGLIAKRLRGETINRQRWVRITHP